MSRKIKHDEEPEPEVAAPSPAPIEIVDLDEAIKGETLTAEEKQSGVSFWIGEVGLLKFADGTSHHALRGRAFITDPKLIANLKSAAENPTNKIFIE